MQCWGRILLGAVVYACVIGPVAWAHDSGLAQRLCEAVIANEPPSPADVGTWAGKTVIIDTNVILNEPNAIYKYPGATVIVPGTVHDEVDDKKTDLKLGRAAREFFRMLESLRKTGGSLKTGVKLGNGATLKIDSQDYSWMMSRSSFDMKKKDNLIIATALYYQYDIADPEKVILISDDISVRIKAASEDLRTAGFDYNFVPPTVAGKVEETYLKFKVSTAELQTFKNTGKLKKPEGLKIAPNQFVILETEIEAGTQATLARYFYNRETPDQSGLQKLNDVSHLPFQPKNIEQAMLLDILMDPTIDLVISQSQAGTGKTFMALLAGMLQVNGAENTPYEQLMVTRTLVQIGKENLGAFPGKKEEKLAEWSENYTDSMKAITKKANEAKQASNQQPQSTPLTQILDNNHNGHPTHKKGKLSKAEKRMRRQQQEEQQRNNRSGKLSNKVQLVAFPHLRGRSISDAFLIMDEAQNSSVHEIKTFLTRAGEGSKFVVLGDASQIDLPFLNERNNGLSVTVSLFTADNLTEEQRSRVGYVRLTEGVRSALAELARQLFEQPLPQ